MLRNHFGSDVPRDLLLLDDSQSIRIKKLFSLLAVCHFKEKLTSTDGQVGIRKAPLPSGTAELHVITYKKNIHIIKCSLTCISQTYTCITMQKIPNFVFYYLKYWHINEI
jgi:hypothetical protein